MILFFLTLISSALLSADDSSSSPTENTFLLNNVELKLEGPKSDRENQWVEVFPGYKIIRREAEEMNKDYRLNYLVFDPDVRYSIQALRSIYLTDPSFEMGSPIQTLMLKSYYWAAASGHLLKEDLNNSEEIKKIAERLKKLLVNDVLQQLFLQQMASSMMQNYDDEKTFKRGVDILLSLGLDFAPDQIAEDFRCSIFGPLLNLLYLCNSKMESEGEFDPSKVLADVEKAVRYIKSVSSSDFNSAKCYWNDATGDDVKGKLPKRMDLYQLSESEFMPSYLAWTNVARDNPLYETSILNKVKENIADSKEHRLDSKFPECQNLDFDGLEKTLLENLTSSFSMVNSSKQKSNLYRTDGGFQIIKGDTASDNIRLDVLPSFHGTCSDDVLYNQFICLLLENSKTLSETYRQGKIGEAHIDKLNVCSENDRVVYRFSGKFRELTIDNLIRWFGKDKVSGCHERK